MNTRTERLDEVSESEADTACKERGEVIVAFFQPNAARLGSVANSEDASEDEEKQIKALSSIMRELGSMLQPSRLGWIVIGHEYKSDQLVYWPFIAARLAEINGMIIRNHIVAFKLEPGRMSSLGLCNAHSSVLMVAKPPLEYLFDKDPIREKHIWRGVEWGDGTRKAGKKTPYNVLGKDPGNFWVRTEDDGKGKVTSFQALSDEDCIERIFRSSSTEGDMIHYLHQTGMQPPAYLKTVAESCKIRSVLQACRPASTLTLEEIEAVSYGGSTSNSTDPADCPAGASSVHSSDQAQSHEVAEKIAVYYKSCENMEEVPNSAAQVVITSPPYWKLRDYSHESQIGRETRYGDYLDRIEPVWAECARVLKPGGFFWLNINSKTDNGSLRIIAMEFVRQCLQFGLVLIDVIIWHKRASVAGLNARNLVDKFEYILVFSKPGGSPGSAFGYANNQSQLVGLGDFLMTSMKSSGDLSSTSSRTELRGINAWIMDQKVGSISKDIDLIIRGKKPLPGGKGYVEIPHTALFPTELVRRALALCSRVGDLVVDPFLGSGTSAVVAAQEGRRFAGYELNRAFRKLIEYRVSLVPETKQTRLSQFL